MVIHGRVKKGKVILDNPKGLPEGTEVEVRPVKKPKKPAKAPKAAKTRVRPRSLSERLANVIGITKGLPPDASKLDRYLHGL